MITYVAAAGTDEVISSSAAYLERIIVGKDVGSSVIEISNSSDDGDGNVKIHLAGSELSGVYEIGAEFNKGICADITNQTNVSFVWKPMSQ
jgi:hypothetical protein